MGHKYLLWNTGAYAKAISYGQWTPAYTAMGNWSLIIKMKVSFPQLVCAEIERETIADSETVF